MNPLAAGNFMFRIVGNQVFEMLAAIAIAQFELEFGSGRVGDFRWIIDRVQVGQQRHGEPIVAVDAVIAAEDDAHFAVAARAQVCGRVSADAIEENGGVAGGIHGAEAAEGLLDEQGRIRTGRRTGENRKRKDQQDC